MDSRNTPKAAGEMRSRNPQGAGSREDSRITAIGMEALSSYIWLQQAFLSLFALWNWEFDILESVKTGAVSYELLRPLVRRYPAESRTTIQNACSPITAGASGRGISPLKIRRGTFCMEAKGVSSANFRKPSGPLPLRHDLPVQLLPQLPGTPAYYHQRVPCSRVKKVTQALTRYTPKKTPAPQRIISARTMALTGVQTTAPEPMAQTGIYGKPVLIILTFLVPLALVQHWPLQYLFISWQSTWKSRGRGRSMMRSNRASERMRPKASIPLAKHSARDVPARITA